MQNRSSYCIAPICLNAIMHQPQQYAKRRIIADLRRLPRIREREIVDLRDEEKEIRKM